MKKIQLRTRVKKLLSDIYTPVGIYLRVRDRFRDTILLESTDYHTTANSYSFIGIQAIGGIEIMDFNTIEYKLPGEKTQQQSLSDVNNIPELLWNYLQTFEVEPAQDKIVTMAQGVFGYTSYDAIQFFDTIQLQSKTCKPEIPLIRYRLYQYVIIINHFKDEMYLCEHIVPGIKSEIATIETLIKNKDVPAYPFVVKGQEVSNMEDTFYVQMVEKGIEHACKGDVFQLVLSRRFQQAYTGDEFNVYRALRSINPSPYLFYFDYGDYKLMGSSPESQVILKEGKAIIHPIAGTFKRTGDEDKDRQLAEQLLQDAKENAEHVMLVDLARNDLSRLCDKVTVTHFKQIQYYSHVIHLVSEVTGKLRQKVNPFGLLAVSFPAGTVSGAPKYKAMQLIDALEPTPRSYYAGCIGFMGFDGSCNHALMIRTMLSKQNILHYQAGAGIVSASNPQSELQEVHNKLNALKTAIELAQTLN